MLVLLTGYSTPYLTHTAINIFVTNNKRKNLLHAFTRVEAVLQPFTKSMSQNFRGCLL